MVRMILNFSDSHKFFVENEIVYCNKTDNSYLQTAIHGISFDIILSSQSDNIIKIPFEKEKEKEKENITSHSINFNEEYDISLYQKKKSKRNKIKKMKSPAEKQKIINCSRINKKKRNIDRDYKSYILDINYKLKNKDIERDLDVFCDCYLDDDELYDYDPSDYPDSFSDY